MGTETREEGCFRAKRASSCVHLESGGWRRKRVLAAAGSKAGGQPRWPNNSFSGLATTATTTREIGRFGRGLAVDDAGEGGERSRLCITSPALYVRPPSSGAAPGPLRLSSQESKGGPDEDWEGKWMKREGEVYGESHARKASVAGCGIDFSASPITRRDAGNLMWPSRPADRRRTFASSFQPPICPLLLPLFPASLLPKPALPLAAFVAVVPRSSFSCSFERGSSS